MGGLTLLILLSCGSSRNVKPDSARDDTDAEQQTDGDTTHDVVVVGAGSAGLYAAKTLIGHGYDVLLIEATDRIGGRVRSETLGDVRLDLGAEEHYLSIGDNPVWPAIREAYGESIYVEAYQGLTAYSMDSGTRTCWTSATAQFPCREDSDVAKFNDFEDWYWRLSEHTDPESSLADDVYDEYGIDDKHRAYHLFDQGLAGATYATDLWKLGARSLALQDSQWDLSGDTWALGNPELGYIDALRTVWWDEVVAGSDLLLNSPVIAIDTTGGDVVVTDSSGAQHAARQVTVTVSIGVLQSEMIDFEPDLPSETVEAYKGIGIDKGMKVPMRFSSAWWETEGEPLAWLITEGPAGGCWVPSDYKEGSTSKILMCYPMGANGATLSEIGAVAGGGEPGDAAIVAAILADLDAVFPDAPGAASANFIEGIVQDWGAAPYTLGVYSYPMVGTYTSASESHRATLQESVADRRIYFAGEATHNTHPSTVVGALHEGERAAEAVHSVNGQPGNPPQLP
ncbi:MAG: NAD(P)/FAD-dependent oxidoreductase [Chloroflexi bacterium]|nr:NAD(P)/FAD-dependent oxidoreductase [Chloroflexota bacterium]